MLQKCVRISLILECQKDMTCRLPGARMIGYIDDQSMGSSCGTQDQHGTPLPSADDQQFILLKMRDRQNCSKRKYGKDHGTGQNPETASPEKNEKKDQIFYDIGYIIHKDDEDCRIEIILPKAKKAS